MADELVTPKDDNQPAAGFPDVEKHNKEVADKLASQDVMGQSTAADPNADAGSELDKLAKAAETAAATPPTKEEPVTPPAQTAEEKAAAEAQAAADAKAAEEREAQAKKADEYFKDSPTLPPNASPKSSEAFSAIKVKAAQEISERDQQIEALKKQIADAEEKLKNSAPVEAVKELEEHRQWRAKLDVEADPKFKEYDRQVSSSQEFIYAQLRQSPAITDAVIAEIKKHGGPENVKMDKIFAAINDPMLQRIIESKLADIAVAKYHKQDAIKSAKENIQTYIQERAQKYSQQAVQHNQATEKYLGRNLAALDWFKTKEVPANADEATKKSIAEENKWFAELRGELQGALKDDSAEMRATLLTGMAQLFKLQRDQANVTQENTSLKKQVEELTDKLNRIKKAGLARPKEGGAAPGASVKVEQKTGELINKPATQAVDDLMKSIMEERSKAATS